MVACALPAAYRGSQRLWYEDGPIRREGGRVKRWVAVMICGGLLGCSGVQREPLGLQDGKLAPCPASPNCVATQSGVGRQRMQPLPFATTRAEAHARLRAVITAMPRAQIVTDTETYLHVVFASRIFGFKDDVEFFLDEAHGVIHFRAAARLGYSDLGVNRRRMGEIKRRFAACGPPGDR